MSPFQDFDLSNFWNNVAYALETLVLDPPTDELIASIEKELGYTLPESYKFLMKQQNGGIPHNTCFPTSAPTSWDEDHIAISSIKGIGRDKIFSLCGRQGSQFMIDEWGYPDIGVCICDCPSAGHDMIMLDYRKCGKDGEPEVIHVDQEFGYHITFLAKDFETFIKGLVHEDVYNRDEEALENALLAVNEGNFSPEMALLMAQYNEIDFNKILRNLGRTITLEKGHFSLHEDPLSYLMYDIQFLLYTHARGRVSRSQYLMDYPKLIALSSGTFSTGGYAPAFVEKWLDQRIAEKKIRKHLLGGLSCSKAYKQSILSQLEAYI